MRVGVVFTLCTNSFPDKVQNPVTHPDKSLVKEEALQCSFTYPGNHLSSGMFNFCFITIFWYLNTHIYLCGYYLFLSLKLNVPRVVSAIGFYCCQTIQLSIVPTFLTLRNIAIWMSKNCQKFIPEGQLHLYHEFATLIGTKTIF